MHPDAQALITRLHMVPIPLEGGWFVQTWRASTMVPAGSVGGDLVDKPAGSVGGDLVDKPAGTAILALFCDGGEGFSALHRLATTEIWHFCGGDEFTLLLLHPDGSSAEVVLGPDVARGDQVQWPVPAGTWMGGHVVAGGRFALLGCTMAPGFTSEDFELGKRQELSAAYPDREAQIARLTRR